MEYPDLSEAINYKDLEYIASRINDRLKKVSNVELDNSDILTIIRIGVLEYGSQCVQNNKDFKLRRFGCFKVKDCSMYDENVKEFLTDKKAKNKQRTADRKAEKEKMTEKVTEKKKKLIEILDKTFDSSIFVSLNDYNDKIKILNDNGNWNGNFGKCESRPPVRQMGDVLYQDDEQRS